ncbi:uncharacterized protein B0I36DRAFT_128824 [Microdochium trichocladiopsis]|uniref:Uncharacterized protein n=1 Tax=Microdochium trichocladiopsis TaxID=1682393 RepID=A0A9P8Y3S7_9PEZI|nr:uncharacterized protein B0I36DRAFT_128824 [Microdochium trichocladiopsis]KAH7029146.1 hypothetical protein B0I36DRAFT_128824 [Microdochium trichocladiopsis]
MTSVTTAVVPSGQIQNWCIQPLFTADGNGQPVRSGCANATLGTSPPDFQTICCSGVILYSSGPRSQLFGPSVVPALNSNSQGDLWGWAYSNATIDNFACYDLDVGHPPAAANDRGASPAPPQQRREEENGEQLERASTSYSCVTPLLPSPASASSSSSARPCLPGSETPLASLAGTNTDNIAATAYELTYPLPGGDGTGTLVAAVQVTSTATPTCLWFDTAHGQPMASVTVAAAAGVSTAGGGGGGGGGGLTSSQGTGGNVPPPATPTSAAVSLSLSQKLRGSMMVLTMLCLANFISH